MKSKIILIVENHALIIDSYSDVIEQINLESNSVDFSTKTANNWNDVLQIFEEFNKLLKIVVLRICLAKMKIQNFLSGEYFGTYAKKALLEIKWIIITSINDNYRIYYLLKNTNPNCLLLKTEVSKKEAIKLRLQYIVNYLNPT